jgi:NADPH:quinone reductase-like Zn-dependent oxidoreductase
VFERNLSTGKIKRIRIFTMRWHITFAQETIMKAAVVKEAGKNPVYGDFKDPVSGEGEVSISVTAAALSQLARGRASGSHYSSPGVFPFVAGVDGVGRLDNGRRVYFVLPKAPQGSMAERVSIRREQCIDLPDDLDDVTAAAIANPGMSSWAALRERAKIVAGETVLINGATGTSGSLAVQIAKHLGAKKVIATGRNVASLNALTAIGADVIIPLVEDLRAMENAFKEQFQSGVDIVIDYLWGTSAERLLTAAAKGGREAAPIRFVQIGSMSGQDITLSSSVLRSTAIELMGSGIGSVSFDRLLKSIEDLLKVTVARGFKIATKTIPLADVEKTWDTAGSAARTVYQI